MRRTQGFLIRFIDLGLLLLMAFLVVAELNPTHQESFPGDSAEQTRAYALIFDEAMRLRIITQGRVLCETSNMDHLLACLQSHPAGRILLTPARQASVQMLVTLMDYCEVHALDCTIAADR